MLIADVLTGEFTVMSIVPARAEMKFTSRAIFDNAEVYPRADAPSRSEYMP